MPEITAGGTWRYVGARRMGLSDACKEWGAMASAALRSRSWLALVSIIGSAVSAAEAPFRPRHDVPDYVATYVDHKGRTSAAFHHGGWTRIDRVDDLGRTVSEYHGPGPLVVEMSGWRSLSITRGADRSWGWDHRPINTGEVHKLLQEQCYVWDVARTFHARTAMPDLRRLSCVTDDGIELSSRLVGGAFANTREVTSLQRKPVSAKEVQPPSHLFSLKDWLPDEASGEIDANGSDVTVVLNAIVSGQVEGHSVRTKTVRRHRQWIFEDTVYFDGERQRVYKNSIDGLTISYATDASSNPLRLNVLKSAVALQASEGQPELQPLKSTETILAEQCVWHRSPFVSSHNRGQSKCLTADGISLREWAGNEGDAPLTAVILRREHIARDEIIPPASMLEPSLWGLPRADKQ